LSFKANARRFAASNLGAGGIVIWSLAMVEKIIDLIGISSNSIEDAVQIALARAGVTISGIHRAQIKDISVVVDNNLVTQWRVAIQASFLVKDQLHE
jgi:flavin-binding protein dodecin